MHISFSHLLSPPLSLSNSSLLRRRKLMRMDVIFERSGVNPFIMKIDLFDTVPEIKEKIHKCQGIPISEQTLIFENTVLTDDFNVLFSNIIEQSRIQLVVASDDSNPPAAKKMKTAANILAPATSAAAAAVNCAAKTREAAAENVEQQQQVKQRIEEGIPTADSENRVRLVRAAAAVKVVVVYEGKKIPVEVNKEERVSELRKKLEKMKVKLPSEGCFFIHKQELMEDEESFRWHKVAQGDEIDMFAGKVTGGS